MDLLFLQSFEAIWFKGSVSRATTRWIRCQSDESLAWAAAPDADISICAVASDALADHVVCVLAGVYRAHDRGALRGLYGGCNRQYAKGPQDGSKLVHEPTVQDFKTLDGVNCCL